MRGTGVVLYTRDLRVHDHEPLAVATRTCERVIPLFVLDDRLLRCTNRASFLAESIVDLDRALGGTLVVRRGRAASVVAELAPDVVFLSSDVTPFAREREAQVRAVAEVRTFPGATVVAPGRVTPARSDHYRVFGPYWRAWQALGRAGPSLPPAPVRLPDTVERGRISELLRHVPAPSAARLPPGGERAGLAQLERFVAADVARYGTRRDELTHNASSRLSAYLHLGCVSPAEVARRADATGADAFLRQLCWRDFFAQLMAARPSLATADVRPVRGGWIDDPDALAAWRAGATGYPIVDAGMRQLLAEGWLPNRLRLIVASFLTKHLLIDWRHGASHFMRHLVDGDVASNAGNWQWAAGTGTDPRPGRTFNPTRQGRRFDPAGAYVRTWVPELAGLPDALIHDPPPKERRALRYPRPLVEHRAAIERWRAVRGRPDAATADARRSDTLGR